MTDEQTRMLILIGGPYDGKVVESNRPDSAVPDSLWFDRAGKTVGVTGDVTNPLLCFTHWRISEPVSCDDVSNYERTEAVDTEGRIVFEYLPTKDTAMTVEQIFKLAVDFHAQNGRFPTVNDGVIPGTDETWASVDKALRRGEGSLKAR